MRRLLLALIALAALSAAASAPGASTATYTVKITRTAFSPSKLTIKLGDRVTWKNADTVSHQVVADNGAFASPILGPGKSYSFTFRDCCSYPYHDALHPKLKGTVTVKGPPPSLSLVLTPPILRFNDTVTVTAQVSAHKAGETVAILATPFGGMTTTAATLTTDANGIVTYTSQPPLYTTYQAKWKSLSSQKVAVEVRPRLTLLPFHGRLFARVFGAHPFAGRSIFLQRLSVFDQWVIVARFTLGARSGRVFTVPRRSGVYRVFMSHVDAGAGYMDGWSGTQRIRRR